MIKNMKDAERDAAFRVADAMCAAAHTAPKANGLDKIRTLIISGEDIEPLAKEMEVAGKEYGLEFFCRDADNIRNSHCVVLIAAMGTASGVPHCAMCGFENCAEMSTSVAFALSQFCPQGKIHSNTRQISKDLLTTLKKKTAGFLLHNSEVRGFYLLFILLSLRFISLRKRPCPCRR